MSILTLGAGKRLVDDGEGEGEGQHRHRDHVELRFLVDQVTVGLQ